MNIEKIKKALLKIRPSRGSCAGCEHKGTCLYTGCKIINEAVGTLDELKEELRSEMHRHDRLQDFEVAEARELEKLKAERRWIPVTEGMPEHSENVLVCVTDKIGNIRLERAYLLAQYCVEDGWVLEMWPEVENPNVTHWMPLPEPPREDTV